MKKHKIVLFFGGMFIPRLLCGQIDDLSTVTMRVEVTVVDEDGERLDGAEVKMKFNHSALQRRKTGEYVNVFLGESQKSSPVVQTYTATPTVLLVVKKEGYWGSGLRHRFVHLDRIDGKTDGSPNGQYGKAFTVVLRKKVDPRPLYVHSVSWIKVPERERPIGFDLEKGDWVKPYGTGAHSDFIFTIKLDEKERGEYWSEMTVGFSEEEDGISVVNRTQAPESTLLLGPVAPETGYQNEYVRSMGVKKEGSQLRAFAIPDYDAVMATEGIWFRVRSRVNENGELAARYGKLLGPIRYKAGGEKQAVVKFAYFLAPDASRSLEWNGESLVPKANLQGVDTY